MKKRVDVAKVANLTKRERIALLLEHWVDYHETLHAIDHDHLGGGDPDAVAGMPAMFRHPSVVELRRSIAVTRRAMPTNTAHLMAFYESEWRIATKKTTRKRKKTGKLEVVEQRVRERIVPAEYRRKKAELAFDRVVSEFRGAVHVPSELLEELQAA